MTYTTTEEMKSIMHYFAVSDINSRATDGQEFSWPLPHGKRPGKWLPMVERDLEAYENGYEVYTPKQLLQYLGPMIWEVEVRGELLATSMVTMVREARIVAPTHWNERTARLFACDCATRVLKAERKAGHEPDQRSRDAVKVARRYAEGKATEQELIAARVAAWAAFDASNANDEGVTRCAFDPCDVYDTRSAMWHVSNDTLWADTGVATWEAELRWEVKRLLEYLDGKRGV